MILKSIVIIHQILAWRYFLKQQIPVWVINLKKRPDRLEKITARLDQLGIKWGKILKQLMVKIVKKIN